MKRFITWWAGAHGRALLAFTLGLLTAVIALRIYIYIVVSNQPRRPSPGLLVVPEPAKKKELT